MATREFSFSSSQELTCSLQKIDEFRYEDCCISVGVKTGRKKVSLIMWGPLWGPGGPVELVHNRTELRHNASTLKLSVVT